MLIRITCLIVAVLSVNIAACGQDNQTLRQVLDSIDFSGASIAVSKAERVKPGASSFVEIFKGFRLASVDGCTVLLRNEGTYKRSKFLFDVTIPLADLDGVTEIVEALEFEKIKDPEDFGPWLVLFRTKRGRRSIALNGYGKKRLQARGARMQFGLHDRQAAEKLSADFQRAVQMCTGGQK